MVSSLLDKRFRRDFHNVLYASLSGLAVSVFGGHSLKIKKNKNIFVFLYLKIDYALENSANTDSAVFWAFTVCKTKPSMGFSVYNGLL